ncbi:hypothetical protein NEFER03_0755 [Nematocida sp. LUAm3]|nr:hypothetical protein NEFER03_0755 [Nematocida sp. LUAm3]KAI5175214.1 hypothetical protein NEFER02_1175 [Nematocida sp. LUAm2]KAI5178114.1 hypothetical protein NEFER01_1292 [Nematocida sp. LUAm1]
MVECTWKERAEKYKSLEKQWKQKKPVDYKDILGICKETLIPAVEAGLCALVPLAEQKRLQEREREVLTLLFKHITTNKPTVKEALKKLFHYLGESHSEQVVLQALPYLKEKNPKIVTETIKVLHEDIFKEESAEFLLSHMLPLCEFFFSHGSGAVREEATRLFQMLRKVFPEQVDHAISTLRPAQIKEICTNANTHTPSSAHTPTVSTTPSSMHTPPVSTTLTGTTTPTNTLTNMPTNTLTSSGVGHPSGNVVAGKVVGHPSGNCAGSVVVAGSVVGNVSVTPLPSGFFSSFSSALWKDRLVVEELNEKLGERGVLSVEDSVAFLEASSKKYMESNNKVFIAMLLVMEKVLSKKISESQVREIVRNIGKRLKDKKVSSYVSQVILKAFSIYPITALEETLLLLRKEKAAKCKSLLILSEALFHVPESNLLCEVKSEVIEACRDGSSETRNQAAICLSVVLFREETYPSLTEIEELGVEKILAQKVLTYLEELPQRKEKEIEEIVESLCEEIRSTTIINEFSRSIPATPIKNDLKNDLIIAPLLSTPIIATRSSEEQLGNPLWLYILRGTLPGTERMQLIRILGEDHMQDNRVISILAQIEIPKEEHKMLLEKLNLLSENFLGKPYAKFSLEALKGKLEKEESSIFLEKCKRAALMERLFSDLPVPEEEILSLISSLSKKSIIIREEEAKVLIKRSAEEDYGKVLEKIDEIFPLSKTLPICVELAEESPHFLQILLFFLERSKTLPCAPVNPFSLHFLSFLEKVNNSTSRRILELSQTPLSPAPKRIRLAKPEEDVNSLLNDIIDQDPIRAHKSLEKLDAVTQENIHLLMESASTLVNVLLLQLNDALSSGAPEKSSLRIIAILKRVSSSEMFLSNLDTGTLLSITSDYIMIVTGQMPRGTSSPESIRKECGETLLKLCASAPPSSVFKIYMSLLCNRYKEEKVREVLVKLIWKHSKLSARSMRDKKVASSLLSSLNGFYSAFQGDLSLDPLISKVLHLHLIEMLKIYREELPKAFKLSGVLLMQISNLSHTAARTATHTEHVERAEHVEHVAGQFTE